MFNVNLISVGKLKEDYLRKACDEYRKRLSAYCRFNIVELAESKLSENPSDALILKALENEAKMITQHLKNKDAYNIAMCIEGTIISSTQLAERFVSVANNAKNTVNFVIGSSFGIDESVKNMCDFKMSMSKMTFPHQLARVMLSEQVYRAFTIINHKKYHK